MIRSLLDMKLLVKVIIGYLISMLFWIVFAHSAGAVSTSQFNAGNIIDDSVFFNSSSMNANDIQTFLNGKVPSCDTNGTANASYYYNASSGKVSFGYFDGGTYVTTSRAVFGQRYNSWTGRSDGGTPFTCVRDYVISTPSVGAESGLCNAYNGGTKSAAQIIYDIGQSCGINPQVLIVLLEKEQGLITDVWPQGIQYQAATGYACPDTASCNPTYYGFFNQVYYGARQYKLYAKNIDSYAYRPGRTVNIQYNPNTSCGNSGVYIQNQATANLYIYTPYQPNAATLAANEGVVVDCGAYGNLNFWRRFNDWFGPSVGPLVKTSNSGDLYYSDGITKYRVTSMDLANEFGLGLGSVRTVSQATIDGLGTASPNPYLTYLVKSNSDSDADGGNIYLISGGRRYTVTDMSQFSAFGFNLSDISYLDYSQLLRMPVAGNLPNFVRSSSTSFVYQVSSGAKHGIFEGTYFNTLNPSGVVIDLSPLILNSIPTGIALINSPLSLKTSDGRIWYATSAGWYSISSMNAFYCLGLDTSRIIEVSDSQTTTDSSLGTASCMVRSTDGKNYVLDRTNRYTIDASWNFITGNLTAIDDSLINSMTTVTSVASQVFKSSGTGALYVFDTNKKRHIFNMSSFTTNGYSASNIVTLSDNTLNTIPQGNYKLADGFTITDSSGAIYLLMGNTRLYIDSMNLFYAFGLDQTAIVQLSTTELSSYSAGSNLTTRYTTGSEAYLNDRITSWNIPTSIKVHYGINGSTPVYSSTSQADRSVRTATRFIKSISSPIVYYLENGSKRPISTWNTVISLGGSNEAIMSLSDYNAALFTTGSSI